MNPALLVIHDTADPGAGGRWADLLHAWPGDAIAPDLPGHGEAPPPTGGHYKAGDAAIAAWRAADQAGITSGEVWVLGHGWGAFAAEIVAAAGLASRLILVDGLGGPWCTADELVADRHRWLRHVLADPAALAPPATVPDPRLAHGFPSVWDRDFIGRMRRSITVPVLAIESDASPTPSEERNDRLRDFAGSTELAYATADLPGAVTSCLRQAGWIQP
ncbi:MAG: alpha/beta fold hydrolase [Acidimicrobiia bacterium]|nr:alpha/beta fold hydrolase [Acidimicrobiia bacterium]